MTTIYGIKNCDTMKKALKWLEGNHIEFKFHDYKKDGVNEELLKQALEEKGWENVLNKRGTTWRNLPDEQKESMDDDMAFDVAADNPSIIKRPLLHHNGQIHIGFSEEAYKKLFV